MQLTCDECAVQDVHPDGVAPNGTNANEDTCTTDTHPTPNATLAERRILLLCGLGSVATHVARCLFIKLVSHFRQRCIEVWRHVVTDVFIFSTFRRLCFFTPSDQVRFRTTAVGVGERRRMHIGNAMAHARGIFFKRR